MNLLVLALVDAGLKLKLLAHCGQCLVRFRQLNRHLHQLIPRLIAAVQQVAHQRYRNAGTYASRPGA